MSSKSTPTLTGQWFSEAINGSAQSYEYREKCAEEQTPYQKIEIYDTTRFGKLMVIDGCVMLTTLDNFLYHEMMSHPVLFCHPDPREVAIVGGGDCGTLREVLQHSSVQRVQQIDIDERVTRLAEEYFPELCTSNHDPRAHLYFQDAIEWMKKAPDDSLDVIIVDSTDPIGPGEGLFNRAFYSDCLRALRAPGILIHQSESPLLNQVLLRDMHTAMSDAGYDSRQTITFPQPCYPSGWWSGTMAAKGDVDLTRFRVDAARNRGFATRYYSEAIHQASLALPPMLQGVVE